MFTDGVWYLLKESFDITDYTINNNEQTTIIMFHLPTVGV